MNKKNGIDQVYQQSFQDFVDMPSDAVWAGLEGQLTEKNKQLHRIRFYKRSLIVALFLLLIVSSFLVASYINDAPKQSIIDTVSNDNKNTPNTPKDNLNQTNLAISDIDQEEELELTLVKEPNTNIYSNDKSKITKIQMSKERKIDKKTSVEFSSDKDAISSQYVINAKIDHFSRDHMNQLYEDAPSETINKEVIVDSDLLELRGDEMKIESRVLDKMSNIERLSIGFLSFEKDLIIMNEYPFIAVKPMLSDIRRWSVSPYLRYAVTGRNIKGTSNETNFFDLHESNSSAISYGLGIDYQIDNAWSIKSGIDIQKIAISTNTQVSSIYNGGNELKTMVFTSFNTNNIQFELDNSSTYQNGELINIAGVFRQETTWLQIPLMTGYHYNKHKWSIDISSGISTSIFLDDDLDFKDTQNVVSNFEHTFTERSAKTYISYIGEVNVHFLPKENLDLYIGLFYQNALSSANKNKNVQFLPYSYGLQLGSKIFL